MEMGKNEIQENDYKQMYLELKNQYASTVNYLRGVENSLNLLPLCLKIVELEEKFDHFNASDIVAEAVSIIREMVMPKNNNVAK